MAKHTTTQCRKFKRALRELSIPGPHLLGYLEYIWQSANLEGNPVFADMDEVEAAAEWSGEPRTLATALIDTGWLDRREDGKIEVHDYWEHAPKFVQERERLRVKRHANKFQQIPTNSNKRQQKPTTDQMLDTTDTDTDTSTNTDKKNAESGSRTRAREASQPTHISAVFTQDPEPDLVERIVAVTGEPEWREWWVTVVSRLDSAGVVGELDGWVRYAENCADPVQRERKDLGELMAPGGFLIDKATALCKRAGVRWPAFPRQRAKAQGG